MKTLTEQLMKNWRRYLKEGKYFKVEASSWSGIPMSGLLVNNLEDEEGEEFYMGEMISDIMQNAPEKLVDLFRGDNPEELMAKFKARVDNPGEFAGPVESWDGDVFSEYYGVDLNKLMQTYAEMKGYEFVPAEEEDEEDEEEEWEW